MTPDTLEAIFVQREKLAERLVELIREDVLTSSKHHSLLIGPRGIGKTHLISIVYHRICAMEDLKDRLSIAWLREDEWGLTSFMDMLLRILHTLHMDKVDSPFADQIEALYELSPKDAEGVAKELIRELIGDHTLLIIVENLDNIFKGLGEDGQNLLRAFMQENQFVSFLATSQRLFNGVSRQKSPFYGTFSIHHLKRLEIEDAVQLLAKIADYRNDHELSSYIRTPWGRSRIRAVQHLAGSNHRVFTIFSRFLTRETLNELVEPFMNMIDDLTPYYQSRMAELPPQQRKIVDLLCDRRGAVVVKEIARRCFLTPQSTSALLRILREKGYVTVTTLGRESYYELNEPLMRLCVEVKKHRAAPIRLLVDFLRIWYTHTELKERLINLLPDASLEREYIHHALKVSKNKINDPGVEASLRDFKSHNDRPEIIIKNIFTRSNNPDEWRSRIKSLFELYSKYEKLPFLGHGLVRSLPALNSPMVSPAAAQKWFKVWTEIAGTVDIFDLPLRLMLAAVKYLEKTDPRVLLEFAMEEREILKKLLDIEVSPTS
ncbi:MAG: AAA family ATPase [Desulfobacterales bacterium]|nr:AAA family ATPase [Desulfobacterales bacterium]